MKKTMLFDVKASGNPKMKELVARAHFRIEHGTCSIEHATCSIKEAR